ncbi:hypothetical protein FBZ89_13612 [Nitrospirillum amazonense]|uniref:Uncharacterized protein n=1 Tax=Nitrospirillum amazonense TaxID=28077 RepID=A0A560ELF3_9PROT|nr:hypothetical protein [Nitrospirillum amazonense]TWB10075.1 hypothetical protein FBZ89_13612 [Nitrospirillum amazonense]
MHTELSPLIPSTVSKLINQTMARLQQLEVQPDPIVPSQYRQRYGILTSAVRADGRILEAAIGAALNENPHLTVVRNPGVHIPPVVDQIIGSGASQEALRSSHFHYEPDVGRKITPDLVLLDTNRRAIDFIEIKRGLARTDAGKTRQTIRDLRCLRLVGRSYAAQAFGTEVDTVMAAVCSIHGASAVPGDLLVTVEDLERRYDVNLQAVITATYAEFAQRLSELLYQEEFKDDFLALGGNIGTL